MIGTSMRRSCKPRARSFFLTVALCLAPGACGRYETEPPTPEPVVATAIAPARAPATERRPQASRPAAAPGAAADGWNTAQIDWQGYEAGLARAKATKKPVCLVLFTTWCPHCNNYSHVFEDAKVVERARDFVMIRLNADEEREVSARYQPDGGYVPRTFFLSADGVLDPELHAPRPKFLYFYDEKSPASLLSGMDAAARKLAAAK
jgi:protein-disulfide reductase (glutathione)